MTLSAAMGVAEKQMAMWLSVITAAFDPKSITVDDKVSRGLRGPGSFKIHK